MILAVDDEDFAREEVRAVLAADGFSVLCCAGAEDALAAAATEEPEMIISDISMPDTDGFAFRAEYFRRYPHRLTPFVFLSSRSDPASVVRGIEMGADDYLVKPVHPEILKAKVRSILQRKNRYAAPAFYGDLSLFPLVKIMQFCETRGLTGTVEVPLADGMARIRFRGGAVEMDDADSADAIDRLYDQADGTFTIRPQPIDYREIEEVAVQPAAPPLPEVEKPMGRLSGVKLNQRLFQIQTEFVSHPTPAVLTIVILDGKVKMKRQAPADGLDRTGRERLIEEQHLRVEDELREKISAMGKPAEAAAESEREKFGRLCESGFELYRERKYEEALAVWEEAAAIDPGDKTLGINLGILRKKLKL